MVFAQQLDRVTLGVQSLNPLTSAKTTKTITLRGLTIADPVGRNAFGSIVGVTEAFQEQMQNDSYLAGVFGAMADLTGQDTVTVTINGRANYPT